MNKFYFHPRYWLYWLITSIVRLASYLPLKWQVLAGRTLGKCLFLCLNHRKRHNILINIRMCFPNMSPSEQQQLIKDNFEQLGIALFETAIAWWQPDKRINTLANIEGLNHITDALQNQKGVLLVSPHMLSLEVASRILSNHIPVGLFYKPFKNRFFNQLAVNRRSRFTRSLIANKNVTSLIRALKKNKILCYAPDQNYGRKNSLFAPFFGVMTATVSATTRIAQLTGAAVIPIHFYREKNALQYQIKIQPALQNFPGETPLQDATYINQIMERMIAQHPEQYLWLHRRFNNAPYGTACPYLNKKPYRVKIINANELADIAQRDLEPAVEKLPANPIISLTDIYYAQCFYLGNSKAWSFESAAKHMIETVEQLKRRYINTINIRRHYYVSDWQTELVVFEPLAGKNIQLAETNVLLSFCQFLGQLSLNGVIIQQLEPKHFVEYGSTEQQYAIQSVENIIVKQGKQRQSDYLTNFYSLINYLNPSVQTCQVLLRDYLKSFPEEIRTKICSQSLATPYHSHDDTSYGSPKHAS